MAKHLYEDYIKTLETTAKIQEFDLEEYQKQAFNYAKKYQEQRNKREPFTYHILKNAEEHHVIKAIKTAEEFINTIRQLMLSQ